MNLQQIIDFEFEDRCGLWGRCGKVCWGVGKIKGNEEKSVGGVGKVWQSVLDVGEVRGEVWGVWESVWERCGKVCWGMGKGELANLWGVW